MKGSLLRKVSLYARNRLLFPSSLVPLAESTHSRLSFFYSSQSSDSSRNPNKDSSDDDAPDISNEELKKRIDEYLEGNEEAIPSIFEVILERKLTGLTGKRDENDDKELVEQLRGERSLGQEPEDSDLKCKTEKSEEPGNGGASDYRK